MSRADRNGSLPAFLNPNLTASERALATLEGWILGVVEPASKVAQTENSKANRPMTSARYREKMPMATRTTDPGYTNRNGQIVLRKTSERGNDHNQFVYVLGCTRCHHEYGSNGSDIFQRRCPACGGGVPALFH
jgi:hypothetical protein